MKKTLKYCLSVIVLLLAISFFLPILKYSRTSGDTDTVTKYYLYSFTSANGTGSMIYVTYSFFYLLAALALGVSALFSRFKNKNILSSCLLMMASLLCLFSLIPIAQVVAEYKKTSGDNPNYVYSLPFSFYFMFILACALFAAALGNIIMSILTEKHDSDENNREDKLKKIIDLRSQGVLSEEEFSVLLGRVK